MTSPIEVGDTVKVIRIPQTYRLDILDKRGTVDRVSLNDRGECNGVWVKVMQGFKVTRPVFLALKCVSRVKDQV